MSWQGSRRTPSEALVDPAGGFDWHPLAAIARSPIANHELRIVDRRTIDLRTRFVLYLPSLGGTGSEVDIRAAATRKRSVIRQVSPLTTIPAAMAAATSPPP
jgi:hypothetical protein